MKILIVKLSSVGDVVHTLPALHALRKGYSMAEIDWLVEEEASDMLVGNPMLNEVVILKKGGILKDPMGSWRTIERLRAKKYDIILDFQGLFKSAIWLFLAKGKRRIGFRNGRELSHLFLNERLRPYNPDRHAVERYLELARYSGGETSEVDFPLAFSKGNEEEAIRLLRESGIAEGERFITIVPRARWETKLWGVARFGELANEIKGRYGLKVVLVGSEADRGYLEDIVTNAKGVINLAGRTTLKGLAFLMRLSTLVISVDSGPMHIASALNTPVIAIFGPTAPWRTGPYGRGHIVLKKDLKCSPCFSRRCRDNICMKDITVDDVMDAVVSMMASRENCVE